MEADDELLFLVSSEAGRIDRAWLECSLSLGAFIWGRREVRRTEVSGKLKGVLQGAYAVYPECTDGGVDLGQGHSPAG